ncbi:helix-turn-helix transcriptional regulator, partial [Lactobacillus crispatus]|uniref:helix-turn-helix transcriptional regulator n=1 Tax=Lactobacillus crispatus TaxID=47770 RepID=UPI0014152D6D
TGLSPSGLARRSGLDPTTFNKSKRVTSDGRPRWPSTESVAKALAATGSSLGSFLDVIANGVGPIRPLPLLNFTDAATRGHFDEDGRPPDRARRDKALPEKKVWRDVALPSATSDEHAYALEISGDDHKPVY